MAALGASVGWLLSAVLGDRWSPEELFAEAASVPAGAEGLIFLPYLAGERAPIFDEGARGAFVGLTLAHGRAHLVRAVLEGAAFAMRHVAEPLAEAGAPVLELRLAGRPSPGDLWARIKADVLGVPAAIPVVGETAVLGAAIIAAAAIGAVPSLEVGVASIVGSVLVPGIPPWCHPVRAWVRMPPPWARPSASSCCSCSLCPSWCCSGSSAHGSSGSDARGWRS